MSTVLISGASGLIGSALVPALERGGHRVRRLVRRPAGAAEEVRWNPARRELDSHALEDVDVVINLSGENVGHRWTSSRRQRILSSRVDSTDTIVTALATAAPRPRTLINASAIGFYGERGDDLLDEGQPVGSGFLADVCRQWEAAARAAAAHGARVVPLRTGVVLARQGGALRRMLLPFQLGIGGRLGSGRQWMTWIEIDDLVRAIQFLMEHTEITGPVNTCAPGAVTNAEFTRSLGLELHRPTIFPVPSLILKIVFGEMAEQTLLASQRGIPGVLAKAGFQFECPTVTQALARIL